MIDFLWDKVSEIYSKKDPNYFNEKSIIMVPVQTKDNKYYVEGALLYNTVSLGKIKK
jgi:hypothetical protein